MAKVTGPLMSLSASGAIAGTIVFSIWKGTAYVRQLVTPSNPSSAGQVVVRLITGSIAKAARAVLTANKDITGVGSPFFIAARDNAPSGQSWISFLQKYASDVHAKALANWALIDSTEKGYYTAEAAVIGLSDYTPTLGGEEETGLTAGQQLLALAFFAKDYANMDVDSVTTDTPTEGDVQAFGALVSEVGA